MGIKRSKVYVLGIMLCVFIEIICIFFMYKSWNNKNVVLDNVKLKSINTNNGFAIMIEQEDGTYKESASNTWPEDMMYNEEKSGCIDSNGKAIENSLTYESGIATIKANKTSYCYLYFDLVKDDITIAISSDGESGVLPSSGAYTNSATCSSGSITWNDRYQRIEIGNLKKPVKCNLTFTKDTSGKTLLKSKVEEVNVNNNYNSHGYRYSGKNPNNYVWFNNEMWRIIGSIPTCLTATCGTNTTSLVKIIRNEPFHGIAYDSKASGNTSVWGSNNLYTLLNSYYYGSKDANSSAYCYLRSNTYKSKCDYTYTGINPTGYYGKMLKTVYWNTGKGSYGVTPKNAYTNETATRTVSGYVGLMSASDYGYATSSSYHNSILSTGYESNAQISANWLYISGDEWTNSESTDSSGNILRISVRGYLASSSSTQGYMFRPVVYLDSSIYIISGTGTEADPYIIGM